MLKKVISALFLSTLLLAGCSVQSNDIPKETTEVSTNVTVSDNTESRKNLVFSDKTLYYNKYLYIENLLFFPDPLNNNNLSLAKISSDDTFVSNSSIIDFYPYQLVSIDQKDDNNIYFSSNSQDSGLFHLDYTNSKVTKISDSIPLEMFYIEDKIIYINSKDRFIYYYDLKKNENVLLSNNKSSNLLYNNEYILYKNLDDNSKIYSLKIDGTSKYKITDVSIDSFVIYNNNIFYFDLENNNILCSIDPSTEKITKYLNIKGQNLKAHNGDMYYISTENPNALYSLSQSTDGESFEGNLIYSDFVNDYFPGSNGIYIEKASNLEEITILKK